MDLRPPDISELRAILRLLDDETPEVREMVEARLHEYGNGDVSELLPDLCQELTAKERELLSEILRPVKRERLREDWLAPSRGFAALDGDWELFECHLRLISDFLHDGVSLRQTLPDALDLLAEEAREGLPIAADARDLSEFLFSDEKMRANQKGYYDSRNCDLAWCISERLSNPIGLSIIFMLVGLRLDLVVEGVSFPRHFLCRIYQEGEPLIVDCYDGGKVHKLDDLMERENELSKQQQYELSQKADLGTILIRILNNLAGAFQREGRLEDSVLINDLRKSLQIPTV